MKKIGFFLCLVLIYSPIDVYGLLLKHLTPRPGGIIDSLTRPRSPGGFQLGSQVGGGISFGLGSFGFNLGFNKQYNPNGANQPPKVPHVPEEGGYLDGNPYVPGVKPGYPDGNPYVPGVNPGYPDGNPYVPGVNPGYPDGNPYVPGVKPGYPDGNPYIPGEKPKYPNENPYVPGVKPDYPQENPYIPGPKPQNPDIKPPKPDTTWEDEEDGKEPYYPPPKPDSYEENKKDYPKPGPYDNIDSPKREDKGPRPNWEDIGEVPKKDPKSENYMDTEFVRDGLIQPRLNRRRNKRFIESKVYHVPLLFESNAKPGRITIHNGLNSLDKVSLQK